MADVPQDPSTVLEMLKASRLRAQELREQIMARYEQLVIDREVRASERLLSKGARESRRRSSPQHPAGLLP